MDRGSEPDYQTDRKRSGDYRISRWSAAKWQLRREKVMVCTGIRCPYRFCELPDDRLPPVGSLCPTELELACRLADELHQLFEGSLLRSQPDKHMDLVTEHVIASLLAGRASVRLSRAMEEVAGSFQGGKRLIDRKPFEHVALAMRYMTAAHNRTRAVWDKIEQLNDVARAKYREQRIRSAMIEYGYWNQAMGQYPSVEDAPDWIIEKIDGADGRSGGRPATEGA